MTIHDLTTQRYEGHPAKTGIEGIRIIVRRFVGANLTGAIAGVTPANGDSYKIAKISKHQLVDYVWTVVTDADDTAITLSIGYTDGTNTSATAFEANAALNATGVTPSTDDQVLFDDDGYFLTITPSTLAGMDSDLEFSVIARVMDCSRAGIATALTAPV